MSGSLFGLLIAAVIGLWGYSKYLEGRDDQAYLSRLRGFQNNAELKLRHGGRIVFDDQNRRLVVLYNGQREAIDFSVVTRWIVETSTASDTGVLSLYLNRVAGPLLKFEVRPVENHLNPATFDAHINHSAAEA